MYLWLTLTLSLFQVSSLPSSPVWLPAPPKCVTPEANSLLCTPVYINPSLPHVPCQIVVSLVIWFPAFSIFSVCFLVLNLDWSSTVPPRLNPLATVTLIYLLLLEVDWLLTLPLSLLLHNTVCWLKILTSWLSLCLFSIALSTDRRSVPAWLLCELP